MASYYNFSKLIVFVLCFFASTTAAKADFVAVPFKNGFVGTTGTNPQKANNIVLFFDGALGVDRVIFTQNSSTNQFEIQGNDIPGTLRMFVGTTYTDIPGAIVWRWTDGDRNYSLGFIPASGVNTTIGTTTITGGGASGSSNIGILVINSTDTPSSGSDISGNAAISSVLTSLNTYLSTVGSLAPAGPVTVNAQSTTSTTPTITGSVTLAAGETLSVVVDGNYYTTSNGLSVSSGTWSLTLPATSTGTYDVDA